MTQAVCFQQKDVWMKLNFSKAMCEAGNGNLLVARQDQSPVYCWMRRFDEPIP